MPSRSSDRVDYVPLLLVLALQRQAIGRHIDTVHVVDTVRLIDTIARSVVTASNPADDLVAIVAAALAALGTVAAAYYTKSASKTAELQLTESREERAEQRAVAITAVGVELGRVVRASVRWRSPTIVQEAAADTLDWSDLEPPEWSQFLLVLAQLGQTGAMLAGVGYGDLRDAAVYGRRLRFKAQELEEARQKLAAGLLSEPEFQERYKRWRESIGATIVVPLCDKLDDAHEAINEALSVSNVDGRRDRIDVSGLKSKAARRWQAGLDANAGSR
jgi:hypothetical protein